MPFYSLVIHASDLKVDLCRLYLSFNCCLEEAGMQIRVISDVAARDNQLLFRKVGRITDKTPKEKSI